MPDSKIRVKQLSFFDRVASVFGSSDQPRSGQQLDTWLEDTLKQELKLDAIERDDDGDLWVSYGSAVVFVRAIEEDGQRIHIFSPLLADFSLRPEVYEAINAINEQVPLAKAFVDTDSKQIILAADIFIIDDLSPDYLMATIDLIADRADHYDTRLQRRFGGKTMLDDDEDELDV
jgi:hypothetical protein